MSLLAPETIDFRVLPSLPLTQRSAFPDVRSIYFVLDANDVLLYIGRAVFLRQRWAQHHRLKKFLPMPDVRLAWLEVPHQESLVELERSYILYFNPLVNGFGPIVSSQPTTSIKPGSFGARIRHRREQLGMTQQELADAMQMRQTAISRLEHNGVPNPGADVLKRLARALRCSVDWLIGLYDDESTLQMASTGS